MTYILIHGKSGVGSEVGGDVEVCHREMTAQSVSGIGGTNIHTGKYIYTEDLLALEALSRDGASKTNPSQS